MKLYKNINADISIIQDQPALTTYCSPHLLHVQLLYPRHEGIKNMGNISTIIFSSMIGN